MKAKTYNSILYLIIITIALTLCIQVYWNYKNYRLNKQNFINEVQISFDNALDLYYADLAEKHPIKFRTRGADSTMVQQRRYAQGLDSTVERIQIKLQTTDTLIQSKLRQMRILDSSTGHLKTKTPNAQIRVFRSEQPADSIRRIQELSAIYISIFGDHLKLEALAPLIQQEFKRKALDLPFELRHFKQDSLMAHYAPDTLTSGALKTKANSTFLKADDTLELSYPNAIRSILMQGLSGILLSLLLSLAIISSLFYLLKIIKQQKQLAEIKNDLISNITHEFKTPIATIAVALESLQNFNAMEDQTKTKTYLDLSKTQLDKLHMMVEKLLETATLDGENLSINKTETDITQLLELLVEKHRLHTSQKEIRFSSSEDSLKWHVDSFHFENAISNIIDNAVKYGGEHIEVQLNQRESQLEILISDNGDSINEVHKELIFEKFYRVPKGNTHDVKGFGIGLYTSKKIIEKHGGQISLELKPQTRFKILIPNV